MLEEDQFREAVAQAIGSLPERERLVLSLYYDQELNLREIGQVLDVQLLVGAFLGQLLGGLQSLLCLNGVTIRLHGSNT